MKQKWYDKTESSGEKHTSGVRWCAAVSGGGSSVQFNTNTNNNGKRKTQKQAKFSQNKEI